ncbi:MAG: type I secretion system permease/ATPase [Rhodospirillales bacterium]|nr:type I secretion system permease/ATPase [Rhodospirillales bacterium]MDE0379061.1 type I secretion system permease/ATPase [Rhodospirillales bacterium]
MTESRNGDREIKGALAESRRLFVSVGLFSVFVNILMLTGPLFMLQVYDRVLTSRSEATLVTLIGIVAFLFLMMGILDHARGRVLARAGARLQARLDSRVLRAILTRAIAPAERSRPATGVRDLEAIQRFLSGTGPFAFFDAPWTPVFLCVLFMFHWMLGALAVFSGVLLLLIALLNQARTARLQQEVGEAHNRSGHFVEQMRAGSETVQGLGMQDAVIARSGELRNELLDRTLAVSDRGGFFFVTSKTLRLFLQSMMLGLGAWLAIHGQVSFGVMIAASILLGRALAPIDQAVAQWPQLQRVVAARRSLAQLLEETPPEQDRTSLPAPRAIVEVHGLTVAAPGAKVPAVRGASFRLEPGQAAGIAGPSASGKSTLARSLAGVWRPAAGSVRLDGAELEQYGQTLGAHIGYLPQEVVLFEGTVAENIARMSPTARDEDVVDAAKRTGAHEMILRLPGGYDFQVSAGGAALSGGQRQRIALARAFYGSPVLVVMDEPDSNLDADGTMALARAVEGQKKRGGAAVIVAHRHGAFAQCDQVYVMENGRPTPATRRKAPVRRLQANVKKGGDALPPPERQPAPQPVRAAGEAEGQVATLPTRAPERPEPPARPSEEEVASLPQQGVEPLHPVARRRDEQIAAAIARVRAAAPASGAGEGDEDRAEAGEDGVATVTRLAREGTP